MTNYFRITYFLVLAFFATSIVSADLCFDFESANAGDTLLSLGLHGDYEIEEVEAGIGVDGSKGFDANLREYDSPWPGLGFYKQPGITNVGDSISFSIDAKFKNSSGFGQGTLDSTTLCDFQIASENFSGFFFAFFARDSQANDYSDYLLGLSYFDQKNGSSLEYGPRRNVADLGLKTNGPGEETDFLRLSLNIVKTGHDRYNLTFNLLDMKGNVLNAYHAEDIPMDPIFSSGTVAIRLANPRDSRAVIQTVTYDNFQYKLTPATEVPVVPITSVVRQGNYASGDASSLGTSDDSDFSIRRSNTDVQSRTEFEVEMLSPVVHPTSLEITIEGSVFARTTISQTITLYNFDNASWEQVDTRDTSRFVDSSAIIVVDGNLSRFVDSKTKQVLARIAHHSKNIRQRFSSNTDYFSLTIGL